MFHQMRHFTMLPQKSPLQYNIDPSYRNCPPKTRKRQIWAKRKPLLNIQTKPMDNLFHSSYMAVLSHSITSMFVSRGTKSMDSHSQYFRDIRSIQSDISLSSVIEKYACLVMTENGGLTEQTMRVCPFGVIIRNRTLPIE